MENKRIYSDASTGRTGRQVVRGCLLAGDERIFIEAKEKGRYAITTMRGGQEK